MDGESVTGRVVNPAVREAKSPSRESNHNSGNFLSIEQLVETFSSVSAVHQAVLKTLKSACENLYHRRTKSTLGTHEEEISGDDEIQLLKMFEKYKLPLQTKGDVEELETELEMSFDFLKFFVSELQCVFHSFHIHLSQTILNFGRNSIFIMTGFSHCSDRNKYLSDSKKHIGRVHLCVDG